VPWKYSDQLAINVYDIFLRKNAAAQAAVGFSATIHETCFLIPSLSAKLLKITDKPRDI
jgi:hypothetical protein